MAISHGGELRQHKRKGTQQIPGFGGTAVVTGNLQLASTFKCISMRCPVSADTDDDATATFEYKATSASTWKSVHFVWYDNRATLLGGGANAYANQFRGSIFGLTAGTSYDVRVTVTDPDSGVVVYQDTISTLASTPTTGGTEYYIDDVGSAGDGSSGTPWNNSQWATAMSTMVAGDILHVRAGTYSAVNWTKSGTENAWIQIVGDARDSCIISGSGATAALKVDANYVQVKNLRTTVSTANGVEVLANRHHVWFDNVYVEDIPGTAYDDSAVMVRGGTHHVYVLNSTLLCPSITSYATPRYDGFGAGVYFKGGMSTEGTFIFSGNTVDGKFRDGIGNEGEIPGTGCITNSDIYENTFTNIGDDCIQMEDEGINLRIWGNSLNVTGLGGFATQSSYVGPVYILRNKVITTNTGVTPTIWKSFESAKTFFLHNSIRATVSGADLLASYTTSPGSVNGHVAYNNILSSEGAANPLYATGWVFDHNLYYRTTNSVLVSDSFGIPGTFENVGPGSDLFLATGQEENGVEGDPVWANTTLLTLNSSTSPALNEGKVLANINDADSEWPYQGSAPDIGAVETV